MMNDLPRPLHLALDASPLQERRPTGVARMVRGWVEALLEVHHPLRVTLFLSGDAPLELEHPHAEILELDTGPQYRLVQLPQALKRVRPHLFHSPFMAIPPGSPVPVVATVHEVPSAGSIVAEGVFRTIRQCVWWSIARRRAQGLASISLHTARAARGAGWQGKPFGVIHPCITSCKETGMPFPRRGPVLAVGTLRRKKGVHLGVAGYSRAVNGLSPGHRPDLIWIGTGEPPEVQVPGVRFPGYLPDAEVQSLMKEASCLLVPSVTEGFGLTALEGMSAGCPVVVSAAGALPEVVGRAGWVVPEASAACWGAVLRRVLAGGEAVERRVQAGRRRAGRFSRGRTGGRLLRLYGAVLRSQRVCGARDQDQGSCGASRSSSSNVG